MTATIAANDTVIVRGRETADVYTGRVTSVGEQDVDVMFEGTLGKLRLRHSVLRFVDGRWEATLASLPSPSLEDD